MRIKIGTIEIVRRYNHIILFILSTIIILVISELIIRHCYDFSVSQVTFKGDIINDKTFFKISNDPILLYEWKQMPQRISKGKQKNIFRVIVLGDSITYRLQGSINDYYPKLLQDLLNAGSDGLRYEVINAGVPGYNTIQEVRYLEKRLSRYYPNMVIVGYCTANDRTIKRKLVRFKDGLYLSDVMESHPYILTMPSGINRFLLRKSALYRFLNVAIIRMSERSGWDILKRRVKYFDLSFETENAIERIRKLAYDKNFNLLFLIFPLLNNGPQAESDWIVDMCKRHNIAYIDLRDIFKNTGYEKLRLPDRVPWQPEGIDFCHPNRYGHRLAAEAIFAYFKEHNL